MTAATRLRRRATAAWPAPALLAWGAAWGVFAAVASLGAPVGLATALGVALGAVASLAGDTPWRRVFIAFGFPLSLAASGLAANLPAWGWLLPLALLALVYPVQAWRDAPVFPTPAGALDGMASLAPLPPGSRVIDAGCGLGDGLRALRRAYPAARLEGVEWSWPLRIVAGLRCRDARVRRGDLWAGDWSGFDLVYLFQRPESMPRAIEKALREMRPGAWLASLAFEVPGRAATAVHRCADGRRVWLYRMPGPRPGRNARTPVNAP